MDNIFLVAGIISVIFFIAKFLEMQYIENESKPLKVLIRDTLVVYVSVVFGFFIIEQLNPVIKDASSNISPIAFTDNPPF
jgi:ABC-type phosphate transport system permease subunit